MRPVCELVCLCSLLTLLTRKVPALGTVKLSVTCRSRQMACLHKCSKLTMGQTLGSCILAMQ